MTIPEIRPFRMQDAKEIKRHPKVEPHKPFDVNGPACTMFIDNEPMACFGYDEGTFIAWMVFSTEAKKYPRVAWAVKAMVDDSMSLVPYLVTVVRDDWPEAIRFAQWAGFTKWQGECVLDGVKYSKYVRLSHSVHSARIK